MPVIRKKGIDLVFYIFWFLLAYIIAALVWWFISLSQQADSMADFKERQLRFTIDSTAQSQQFIQEYNKIHSEKKRNKAKYIGEGVTFMLVILAGAAFGYRSVRKQLRMQQQQQNFMMAVTHELKTPIAVANLNLETLQKHKLDEPTRQKFIQMTLQETHRLHSLTSNILVASQLEDGAYKRSVEELDFSQLTISCIEDFRQRFPERKWEMDIEPEIAMEGDTLLLEILINNLLENAHKYSPKAKPVVITLNRRGRQAVLKVKDEGPGVPDGEKKNIFDKFYRIGNEEVRKTKGTGLGLHLCRKIARDHHADINVTNNLPSGSIFTITFNRINMP
ncbi:MAG TPA: ATP-binding protein [Ferruginibacter sp.]|jgi:K+-sensing histidine kinase KdpD|nr:ATP-binding protein [Ferruginibacter sp.]